MDNIIVAVFKNERTAMKGLDRLTDLDRRGEVLVYNEVLVRKPYQEVFDVLEKQTDTQGWQSVAGMGFGGLVGFVGGPVGVVTGMIAGAAVGAVGDIVAYSFDEDFVEKATNDLPVGSAAIIAEVGEPDETFIDDQFRPLGADIWRSSIYGERKRLLRSRIDALKAKIKSTEKAVKQARKDDRDAIKSGLTHFRKKLDAFVADIDDNIIRKELAEDKATLEVVRSETKFKINKEKVHLARKRAAKLKTAVSKDKAELKKLNSNGQRSKSAGAA